jgi:hypothetical protein
MAVQGVAHLGGRPRPASPGTLDYAGRARYGHAAGISSIWLLSFIWSRDILGV